MTNFVALYRGRTIQEARVVGVSVDCRLVQQVAASMLIAEAPAASETGDDILGLLQDGRRQALRRVAQLESPIADDPIANAAIVARKDFSASLPDALYGGDDLHEADSPARINASSGP